MASVGGFGMPRSSFGFGANIMVKDKAVLFKDAPAIVKSFYEEHPEVTALTKAEAEQVRLSKNNIMAVDRSSKNRTPPNPLWKFEHAFKDYPDIMAEIEKNQFKEPSPIQCQMWPVLLSGQDCIGIAQTGTGKTLGFLLPAFIHIEGQPTPRSERRGPTVLVLTPTRELAQQIEREVGKYHYKGIRSVCVYGGGDRRGQASVCKGGVEIVIATPGRLSDLVSTDELNISSVSYLVLDEADRMLDMGFEPQIKKILFDVRDDRQTALTSATWPDNVRNLADSYTIDPFLVVIGSLDLNACENVTQCVEVFEGDSSAVSEAKRNELFGFLTITMQPHDKVIVFVARKGMADHLASDLSRKGVRCEAMHGDRGQCEREMALSALRRGKNRILIATDVASRGLDIEDITYVVNYDFPTNIEEYVHRIGRTGRAGRKGQSITYIERREWDRSPRLIEILEKNNQHVPAPLRKMADRYRAKCEEAGMDPNRPMPRGGFGSRSSRYGYGGGGGGGGGDYGRGADCDNDAEALYMVDGSGKRTRVRIG